MFNLGLGEIQGSLGTEYSGGLLNLGLGEIQGSLGTEYSGGLLELCQTQG